MEIRNYSERTIKTYNKMLSLMSRYYNDQSLDEISQDQVKSYLHYLLKEKQCSVSTINQLIGSWRIFQIDVLGNNWEDIRIKRPRREKRLPVVLSRQEVSKMLEVTKNLKHRCILSLAYSTGMRRQEILQLKPCDIDSKRNVIRIIQGKGNKSREVLLSPMLLEILRNYYRRYRPHIYLFEGMPPGTPYSATSISNIVKRAAKRAGVKKTIAVHTLRHTFATHLLEQGVSLRLIQSFLGHSSMKTTSIYLHVAHVDTSNIETPLDYMQKTK